MSSVVGIILAAGKGTRMKSELPKGLFEVCGVPMVQLIGSAMKKSGISRPVIVVGHEGQRIIDRLGDSFDYAWQTEQNGTGHAVQMADSCFAEHDGPVVITPGDVPLLSAEVLADLISAHEAAGAACTIATVTLSQPHGYGRIVRNADGQVHRIVEEKDATNDERLVQEVNSGVYCFDAKWLRKALPHLSSNNAQGEVYLTDCVKFISEGGGTVTTHSCSDFEMLRGVNDRWQLAEAAKTLRLKLLKELCLTGVTVLDPDSTFIDADVSVGPDTILHPMTYITVGSRIGARCEIGPSTMIDKSQIGDETSVNMSRVNEAAIGNRCKIGPFAHIRPQSVIGDGCKIGNFVELKKAQLAPQVSASHLSYIGDAIIGSGSNIGAGTITCNYDGFVKSVTEIGERVFVGSNSTLVAPIKLEDDSFVAAGSVITKSIPSYALGVGRTRQENKEGWVTLWRNRKKSGTP